MPSHKKRCHCYCRRPDNSERVHSLRSRTPKKAKTTICRLVLNLRSQFFQSRLFFSNQKKLRSHPSLWQYRKTVQFVSFGNPCLRTNQRLYRRGKCLACVTAVRKDFLSCTKITPLACQCQQAASSIRNIRRRHRKGMRQTPLGTAGCLPIPQPHPADPPL